MSKLWKNSSVHCCLFQKHQGECVKIPCAERLPFIVTGLAFLQPALTNAQFYNLTMVATALVLGGKLSFSAINRMWLGDKCVSTLSHFFSHAKFSTMEMQNLYALQIIHSYKLKVGYYCIDDTMKHHTNYCKRIHGMLLKWGQEDYADLFSKLINGQSDWVATRKLIDKIFEMSMVQEGIRRTQIVT